MLVDESIPHTHINVITSFVNVGGGNHIQHCVPKASSRETNKETPLAILPFFSSPVGFVLYNPNHTHNHSVRAKVIISSIPLEALGGPNKQDMSFTSQQIQPPFHIHLHAYTLIILPLSPLLEKDMHYSTTC